jgi:Fe-S-cluster-containing hydrogenase component 2
MSSGEGNIFAEVVDDFSKHIRELGPLGKSEGIDEAELKIQIDDVRKLVPYIKVEKRKKLQSRLKDESEYDALFTDEEIEQLFSEVVSYYINPDKCHACMICRKRCPVEAISGGKNLIHVIDQDQCIKCGTCYAVCPPRFGAVDQLTGESAPPPLPEEQRKIVRKVKAK